MKRTITIETDSRFTEAILAALRLMRGVIRISDTDGIPEVRDERTAREIEEGMKTGFADMDEVKDFLLKEMEQ